MATDNFLDKKSVLGLAERVPMCPPPETIVFADSISWIGSSLMNYNQQQYANNIATSDITNYDLIEKLALGQCIACQIKINGEQEILPLFLAKYLNNATTTTSIQQYTAKGTTVLNDGKIAGVIFTYTKATIGATGTPQRKTITMNCHVYIHDWGTV